jgi:hypothetical protein
MASKRIGGSEKDERHGRIFVAKLKVLKPLVDFGTNDIAVKKAVTPRGVEHILRPPEQINQLHLTTRDGDWRGVSWFSGHLHQSVSP